MASAHLQPAWPPHGHSSIERLRGGQPLPTHLRGAIIALGNFDGFHLGHQEVARRARVLADQRGVAAIVATFDPHPVRHFRPDQAPFRLSTLDQRQRAMAAAGIDAMMVFDFGRELANASPESFVHDWLRDAGGVVTGADFSFGKGRCGDINVLRRLMEAQGHVFDAIGNVEHDNIVVSSTRIRNALVEGDCALAAQLLTRPFAIEGVLSPSSRRFPSMPPSCASVDLGEYIDARPGIYAVRARSCDGRVLSGLARVPVPVKDGIKKMDLHIAELLTEDVGLSIEIEFLSYLHDAGGTP